jgi:hypothetical protein
MNARRVCIITAGFLGVAASCGGDGGGGRGAGGSGGEATAGEGGSVGAGRGGEAGRTGGSSASGGQAGTTSAAGSGGGVAGSAGEAAGGSVGGLGGTTGADAGAGASGAAGDGVRPTHLLWNGEGVEVGIYAWSHNGLTKAKMVAVDDQSHSPTHSFRMGPVSGDYGGGGFIFQQAAHLDMSKSTSFSLWIKTDCKPPKGIVLLKLRSPHQSEAGGESNDYQLHDIFDNQWHQIVAPLSAFGGTGPQVGESFTSSDVVGYEFQFNFCDGSTTYIDDVGFE